MNTNVDTNIDTSNASPSYFGKLSLSLLFIALFCIFIYLKYQHLETGLAFLLVAAVFGMYMALNIGANDVANNVGPAVGSGALTLLGALIIAAIFEASGAILAGGSVTSTIKKGIIDPSLVSKDAFLILMMAALLGAALWLNLATFVGAPVSTTHSIVGGVLGAGIVAGGWSVVQWIKLGQIAASWVISPVMGGIIAALLLMFIKQFIIYKENVMKASKFWVPVLLSIMVSTFSIYLLLKALSKVIDISFERSLLIGLILGIVSYFILIPIIDKQAKKTAKKYKRYGRRMSHKKVSSLFTIPLIASAALLSFAHGSNDVANAIGPLAAIVSILESGGEISAKATITPWVMILGALGLSIGLVLFGPKLIRTVGSEITALDKTSAFCIAMAAAITVIIASQLGLPVSSTHIAMGGIFGVGFLREYLQQNFAKTVAKIRMRHEKQGDLSPEQQEELKIFLRKFKDASSEGRTMMMSELQRQFDETGESILTKKDLKKLKKIEKKQLVKRNMLYRIVAAWIITVPASATIAAALFFIIRFIVV